MHQLTQRNRSSRAIPGGTGGVTTIELLVALVIAAILTAVSLPLFATTLQFSRLDGAARKIGGDLRYVQSLAVSQGNLFRIHSGDEGSVQPGRYRIEKSTDGGGTWTGITQWYLLSTEFTGASLASIKNNAGGTIYEVRFNSRGTCVNCITGGNTPPLVVSVSSPSGTRTVQVRTTGSVSIQ